MGNPLGDPGDPADGPLTTPAVAAWTRRRLGVNLLSVRPYDKPTRPVPLVHSDEDGCDRAGHGGCLALTYRVAGLYGTVHLAPADAYQLGLLLIALTNAE